MPTSPFKTKTFHLTALDREMLDPERGGLNDISCCSRGYFDGASIQCRQQETRRVERKRKEQGDDPGI